MLMIMLMLIIMKMSIWGDNDAYKDGSGYADADADDCIQHVLVAVHDGPRRLPTPARSRSASDKAAVLIQ